jgi:hypothetical protein
VPAATAARLACDAASAPTRSSTPCSRAESRQRHEARSAERGERSATSVVRSAGRLSAPRGCRWGLLAARVDQQGPTRECSDDQGQMAAIKGRWWLLKII